jgi:hypothetical protein
VVDRVDVMKETLALVEDIMNQKQAAELFIIREGLWERFQERRRELVQEAQQSGGMVTSVSKSLGG